MNSSIILAQLVHPPRAADVSIPRLKIRPRMQFGLRSLLLTTVGISILFAALNAIGVDIATFVSAFLIVGGVTGVAIWSVELVRVGSGWQNVARRNREKHIPPASW